MNVDLITYITDVIFPLYHMNDKGHQLWHITGVIERSLKLSDSYNVNLNMVYTIAAFHDIGCCINRKNHEIESAKILLRDKQLKKYFTVEQMNIMADAIEDHRASLEYEPRTIYGKIISTADRYITTSDVLKSAHSHTLENYSDIEWATAVDLSYQYLNKKYGDNGYARVPLETEEYSNFLIDIKKLLNDKNKLSEELKIADIELKNMN